MDRCPLEIIGEIYAFACSDDGRTGRALSLVSRYINETSKPYKLQSVTVVGHTQLFAFANLIENTPILFRRVHCIFLSAHSRHTASDPRALSPEYVQRQQSYAAVERILLAIASCVKVVHAFFVFYRPFILLPVSLPALEELMLHGPFETSAEVDEQIQFISLKHLNMTSSCSPSYLLNKVLKLTPSVIHLSISASDRSEAVATEWSSILNNKDIILPTRLERLYIHVPNQPKDDFSQLRALYDRIILALRCLAETDPRVVLVLPLRLDLFSMVSIQEAITTWSASAAGKPWW
ncbi:hypothetical protein GALMADRAFT_59195 [Galerina marginata CBS 339.88]|uniref:F-box domain-containing protein n=1 Tax=Galerina marginata (strain CBS 339.88) TaxID=685588 RepID=A0A067TSV4_GALM3|nr:hypothetical protein GALMADRAFT_59195 [Galerina marginata CBS 339.88]